MTVAAPTSMQLLAQARDALGHPVPIRPFEELLKVIIKEDEVRVIFRTYSYEDRTNRVIFTKRGRRISVYPRFDKARRRVETETFWEDDYQGEEIVKFGRVYEGNSHRDQREFEADCFRPGTSRAPLDNASRVAEGSTTDKMARHWK